MTNTKLSQRELVEKFRRGERITKADSEYSMFDATDTQRQETCRTRGHSWRVIVCWDSDTDINECTNCGHQIATACNFDEDMS